MIDEHLMNFCVTPVLEIVGDNTLLIVLQLLCASQISLLRFFAIELLTVSEARPARAMDPSEVEIPELKDLTIENITDNVKKINGNCPDPRLKYVLERLVQHMHDFARETRLSTNEWMAGIHFLTAVGQTCTDVRQVRSSSTRRLLNQD